MAFSVSGERVRRLARLHTRLPLLAFTPKPEVRSQLATASAVGAWTRARLSSMSLGTSRRGLFVV